MREISVESTLDGSPEPSLLYVPRGKRRVPLVVGLHTWSCDRHNQLGAMLPHARRRKWALLLPEFRGANLPTNPRARQACGSVLAKQDIVDAVDRVCTAYGQEIDPEWIFLLGGSGGGHMALLMAAYRPTLWRQVSAWCPITDLVVWHAQAATHPRSASYRPTIEACCGGTPAVATEEYRRRSPLSYIDDLAKANVFIYHGRWDGVTGSVPFTHSLQLYTALMAAHPESKAFLHLFDGGHELRYDVAFASFQDSWDAAEHGELSG
jgi:pimeloyl-ACP methyl ester carboxylesterase